MPSKNAQNRCYVFNCAHSSAWSGTRHDRVHAAHGMNTNLPTTLTEKWKILCYQVSHALQRACFWPWLRPFLTSCPCKNGRP